MFITDLFSHKIHSSSPDWPDKLTELAAIFGEFDGQVYNRTAFEDRLSQISPRTSYLISDTAESPLTQAGRHDVSKFRDEISAYPAYLGLYYLDKSVNGWIVRVTETAKRFLLREEPDVASFLRLQLPLFQYPNAMGAAYRSSTNKLRIQTNTQTRTLNFISHGIHLSPVRLIAAALLADASIRDIPLLHASITFDEIFGLANADTVNKLACPDEQLISQALKDIRNGIMAPPDKYESRFHLLKHLELFEIKNSSIRLRDAVNLYDGNQIEQQLKAIVSIKNQFNGFDHCTTANELEVVIGSAEWGKYFDGVLSLPSHIVEKLSKDEAINSALPIIETEVNIEQHAPVTSATTYAFRERSGRPLQQKPFNRNREMADPEIKHIKLQRRNLAHKELIDKMDRWLRNIGAQPKENDHIDLFAKIPNDGSFIFEMKSGGDSLLDQIRKGLSQLYEYRYRYRELINDEHISLCLVLPNNPSSIPWVTDYLCNDRDINLCWFNDDGELEWPISCNDDMGILQLARHSRITKTWQNT